MATGASLAAGPVRPAQFRLPSPLDELHDDRMSRAGLRLFLKRDDLINPEIPGNKWRKLRHNLEAARRQGHDTLITFGGAHSNHIRATAAAGHYFGFATIGMIRGEKHLPLNPSLACAVRHGMRLAYLDRATYREKMRPEVTEMLGRQFGRCYLLPEGGSNALAVRGCAEIPGEIGQQFDVICCACGTGGTLAGIAAGLTGGQRALGFSALRGGAFLARDVDLLQRETYGHGVQDWSIEYGFHFGGFAKRKPELDQFIADFERRHGLTLDWVYVAKMMYGVYDLAARGVFAAGTVIVAVITG
jgi:1-aminocyclopropane-1-carboxylate deaminase